MKSEIRRRARSYGVSKSYEGSHIFFREMRNCKEFKKVIDGDHRFIDERSRSGLTPLLGITSLSVSWPGL